MTPEKLAANLIDEYCIAGPDQLKVEEIANAENLFVIERPLKNFLGMINYEQNIGLITVSSRINSETQKIFTITHEMGHFFNERFKLAHLRGCKKDDLVSYKSKKHNEDNANIFAAEFLMYRPWFLDYTKNTDLTIELIQQTANHFKVSLTAAAIRFIEVGHFPSAIIYCVDKKVKWFAVHNLFNLNLLQKILRFLLNLLLINYLMEEVRSRKKDLCGQLHGLKDSLIVRAARTFLSNVFLCLIITRLWYCLHRVSFYEQQSAERKVKSVFNNFPHRGRQCTIRRGGSMYNENI